MQPLLRAVLFCDDIRHEEGGKVSLIGVYGKRLLVSADREPPFRLPKLCMLQRWEGLQPHDKVGVEVTKDDKLLRGGHSKPFEIEVGSVPDPGDHIQLAFHMIAFEVPSYGEFHFKTSLERPENIVDDSILKILPQEKSSLKT